ncbi:MAG: hypothetical protein WC783_05475 [Candidatus Paceibacterota bacterium]|jgi:Flp pilus assembly protein protease CpaA
MVEQLLVTILAWVATFIYLSRAIKDVRKEESPIRNMVTGLVSLMVVLVVATLRSYQAVSVILIALAALAAFVVLLYMVVVIGGRASEENSS